MTAVWLAWNKAASGAKPIEIAVLARHPVQAANLGRVRLYSLCRVSLNSIK
jgi:hypothetical protein